MGADPVQLRQLETTATGHYKMSMTQAASCEYDGQGRLLSQTYERGVESTLLLYEEGKLRWVAGNSGGLPVYSVDVLTDASLQVQFADDATVYHVVAETPQGVTAQYFEDLVRTLHASRS